MGGVFTKGNALSNASVLAGLPVWVAGDWSGLIGRSVGTGLVTQR